MTVRFAYGISLPLRFIGAVIFTLAAATAALAIEDTPENREKQIQRYFDAVPVESLVREMMTSMAKLTPGVHEQVIQKGFPEMTPEQRAKALELSKDVGKLMEVTAKHIDFAAIKKIQREVLLSSLTADEIAALADFYTSPAGKSAGAKMNTFTQELMPLMTPIMVNAVIRAKAEEKNQ